MNGHSERVHRIAQELRKRSRVQGFASLRNSAVSRFVPEPLDPNSIDIKQDTGELRHVLEIDVPRRRCVAESGVTFRALLDHTLPHGLVPKLVAKRETVTVGGAVAACSVASTSFRYGGFHDSCRGYEVLTANGDVLACSRSELPLLFDMMHGSNGTLGILTKLEFDLIPSEPYVQMRYLHFHTFEAFHAQMVERCSAEDVNFIDGIIHGPDHFVLCLGMFTRHVPWTHAYRRGRVYCERTRDLHDDYLTVRDYYFRYDTGARRLLRSLPVPGMGRLPMRLRLGDALRGAGSLRNWSQRLRPLVRGRPQADVVVGAFVPEPSLPSFFGWYADSISHYPVWVVPYRVDRPYPWIRAEHLAKRPTRLFIDWTVYGRSKEEAGLEQARLLENKTRELGGIKTPIPRSTYDRDRFWSIYDREHYDAAKKQVDPRNLFRDLYDKAHRQP